MKKQSTLIILLLLATTSLLAQLEPTAGNWKTWFISSGKDYRLPQPASYKAEIAAVASAQKQLNNYDLQQIQFWNAGSPGFRWQMMMDKLWTTDTSKNGALANMLLGTAIYDATVAAWNTKYSYKRPRPYEADSKIKLFAPKTESPAYPCEHSVAAGVAVTIIAHFYPHLKDSVSHMAERLMRSRVAAGVAFPSDTQAGFELGRRIAEAEIEKTKDYITTKVWDGKMPEGNQYYRGRFAMFPTAGLSKTVVLQNGSQFRPAPPPDYTKDMAELKNFKQTFRSKSNAFFFASQNFGGDLLNQKLFEYNLAQNPPRAARIFAATAVASYDAFIACWDAKYAYWGIRPDQYDTTYKPLLPTPPFPGYPSGHAVMCGMMAELYSYFFPADMQYFLTRAKDGAESRFQAGIHFRTDNEAGLELGKKVSALVVEKLKMDGAD
jgi:membrane-associated phospholipid phosphatase